MGTVTRPEGCRLFLPPVVSRGFTLIELLVVLVVIGITLGLAAVQLMPDERSVLRDESQRLALLLENAELEAQASGRPLAWSADDKNYLFWEKNDYGDWVRIEKDDMLHPRSLPEGLHIAEVSVEKQLLKPGEPMSLSATSFARPFHILLTAGNVHAGVKGNGMGTVTTEPAEAG